MYIIEALKVQTVDGKKWEYGDKEGRQEVNVDEKKIKVIDYME